MPKDFYDKVQFLCRNVPKVEWSSILYYETEGSIKDPANFKIIFKDMFFMDIGTAAHTAYEINGDVAGFMMTRPEIMSHKWSMGHIHSHNTMKVFFSPEDMSELMDNADKYTYYVSLVVNNFMDFVARVCFVAKPTAVVSKDEDGNEYTLPVETKNEEVLYYYDCEIEVPEQNFSVPDDFKQRFGIVKAQCDDREVEKEKKRLTVPKTKTQDNNDEIKTLIDETLGGSIQFNTTDVIPDVYYEFTSYVFRGGIGIEGDQVDHALEALDNTVGLSISEEELAIDVVSNYHKYCQTFFDKDSLEERYVEVLDAFVAILEEHVDMFPFVLKIIDAMSRFRNVYSNRQEAAL